VVVQSFSLFGLDFTTSLAIVVGGGVLVLVALGICLYRRRLSFSSLKHEEGKRDNSMHARVGGDSSSMQLLFAGLVPKPPSSSSSTLLLLPADHHHAKTK
jgi:hypothetical protein